AGPGHGPADPAGESGRSRGARPLTDDADVRGDGPQRKTALGGRRGGGAARAGKRPEGFLHYRPGPCDVDLVRALAGRGLGEHALGVLPQAVLLELVLELDAEPAREDGEVMLDGDGALRLEHA